MKLPFALLVSAALSGMSILSASSFDVGPGLPLANLRDVSWKTLQPGDIVNIHYKPGGYHEKIQISASGTAAQHIVIRGIPDPATGALPIIDAQGAVEDPASDLRGGIKSNFGLIIVSPRQTGYVYGTTHVSFVDLETLDIRNALYTPDQSITFTAKDGSAQIYSDFSSGIYIEWAHDFAVRGCEISNCGNGLFANSKNLTAQSSERLMIERNYFHDNSLPVTYDPNNPSVVINNGYHDHHCYTESAGVIYQYNRFGRLHSGAHGVAIKDRSSGQIIRYNEFDMTDESNVLNLADPQGGSGYIDVQPDYRDSYVYGNIITIENYTSGISAIFWGAFNGPNFYAAQHRGTLYFYNNTVVSHHNGVSLFLMPDTNYTGGTPTMENVDCRNNIFFSDTAAQNNIYNAMRFFTGVNLNGGGVINLGMNWISPNWRKDPPNTSYPGTLNGTANLIVGDATGANDPHFVNMNGHDYHVLTGSNILDTAGALAPACLPANDVTKEYLAPQSFKSRTQQSLAMDLGALESTGLATPPPPGGALQFTNAAFSQTESGGTATITVARVGGITGAVSVSYATAAGGTASSSTDYVPVVGTLNWDDGDNGIKSFSVPLLNDSIIELNETVSLALFSPRGGSALGTQSSATLTITDDDTPPSTLMYAIGNTSNVIFLFNSGTPGSPLSFSYFSGLVNGDVVRALAVHPITGRLYAIGSAGVLYTLNAFNGAATAVGPALNVALASNDMDLTFDRTTNLLRLVNAAGQNLQIDPSTGALISIDTPISYTPGDVNAAFTPQLAGADHAITNGVHTLYAIDSARDALVTIGSQSGDPLSPASGQLITIGPLGFNTGTLSALHIPNGASYGWACLSTPGSTISSLYAVNLTSGNAISMGSIRTVEQVRDITVAAPRDAWRYARFGAGVNVAATAGDDADPDHNGVSNLMEYALGTPAAPGSPVPLPVLGVLQNHLTLTFTRSVAVTDVIYTVQVSDDLVHWHNGSSYSGYGNVPDNVATTQLARTASGGIETITVMDNATTSGAAKRFMRLQVSSY